MTGVCSIDKTYFVGEVKKVCKLLDVSRVFQNNYANFFAVSSSNNGLIFVL